MVLGMDTLQPEDSQTRVREIREDGRALSLRSFFSERRLTQMSPSQDWKNIIVLEFIARYGTSK